MTAITNKYTHTSNTIAPRFKSALTDSTSVIDFLTKADIIRSVRRVEENIVRFDLVFTSNGARDVFFKSLPLDLQSKFFGVVNKGGFSFQFNFTDLDIHIVRNSLAIALSRTLEFVGFQLSGDQYQNFYKFYENNLFKTIHQN